MQKKPHGPKFTAGRFTLLKRKNFLQKAQDIILPWRLRIKDLIRDRGAYDRSDIFLIEQARFICQKRCGEDDIRRTGAFVCFIPVEDSAVDKYTAAFGQVYLIGPGKAAYFTFGGNEKFKFVMPVPVDAVEIKLPDIFRIIGKRIAGGPVRECFTERVVRSDFICVHRNLHI